MIYKFQVVIIPGPGPVTDISVSEVGHFKGDAATDFTSVWLLTWADPKHTTPWNPVAEYGLFIFMDDSAIVLANTTVVGLHFFSNNGIKVN